MSAIAWSSRCKSGLVGGKGLIVSLDDGILKPHAALGVVICGGSALGTALCSQYLSQKCQVPSSLSSGTSTFKIVNLL